jgi:dTDP-4-dehydrorhamnose reductase
MRPTILLTGKTGQLGSELARLLPTIANVVASDRHELDLRDPDAIRRLIRHIKPQWVVNTAAYTAVDAAESDEDNAFAINAEAPRVLALEAKKLGATIVHFSTDYVFDGGKQQPYVETDPTNPLNAYGRSKLAGEVAIRDSGASHLIFRTSWVYATHGRNFLLTVLRLSTEREELSIVDDQVGAPTCASDLAQAITAIVRNVIADTSKSSSPQPSGTYHMTAGGQTSWRDFAGAILEEARRAPRNLEWLVTAINGGELIARKVTPISTEKFHSPTRRPMYSVLCNAHLLKTFGVSLPDWRAQLQRCFASASTAA